MGAAAAASHGGLLVVVLALAGVVAALRQAGWFPAVSLLLLFGSGAARFAASPPPDAAPLRSLYGKRLDVVGRISSDVRIETRSRGQVAICALDIRQAAQGEPQAISGACLEAFLPLSSRLPGGIAREPPCYGQTILVYGALDAPSGRRDPGVPPPEEMLSRSGAVAVLRSPSPGDWSVSSQSWSGSPLARLSFALRHGLEQHIATSLPPAQGAVLQGMLVGDRQHLPPSVADDLERTGASHLLATAGLHVGLLLALLLGILSLLRTPRRTAAAAAMVLLVLYALMAGGRPAVSRAALVGCIFLLATVLEREPDLWTSLSAAALGLLMVDPRAILDAGFQLTFCTVVSIALLMPLAPLAILGRRDEQAVPPLRWLRRPVELISALFFLALCAQVGSAALVAEHFHEVSLIGVAANTLLVPIAAVILWMGFVTGVAAHLLPFAAPPLDHQISLLLSAFARLAALLARPQWASVADAAPSVWFIALYYAILWGAAILWQRRAPFQDGGLATSGRSHSGGVLLLITLLVAGQMALVVAGAARPSGELKAWFLDVGQGDGAVIETPRGSVMVVDTGGIDGVAGDNEGRRTVGPFLREQGIRRVDLLVLTHPHADHIGGAAEIIDRFPVGLVLDNGQQTGSPEEAQYRSEERSWQVRSLIGAPGERISFADGVTADVLAPTPDERAGVPNNASVVVRVTYGHTALLLMGDAEQPEEDELVRERQPLQCDLLKVGHHGSHTSSSPEFLAAARPRLAVISVGAHNLYGHPSPEIVDRLAACTQRLFRTDRNGAVECISDGQTVRALAVGSGTGE